MPAVAPESRVIHEYADEGEKGVAGESFVDGVYSFQDESSYAILLPEPAEVWDQDDGCESVESELLAGEVDDLHDLNGEYYGGKSICSVIEEHADGGRRLCSHYMGYLFSWPASRPDCPGADRLEW